ncbi:MAG: hypothetical protein AAF958_17650 [Planctomycetota bacterium]
MIRAFHNGDLPGLAAVWQAHHGTYGPAPNISSCHVELAILGRPGFEQSQIQVATDDHDKLLAWLHWHPRRANQESHLLTFVADPRCSADQRNELLRSTQALAGGLGRIGLANDHHHGYAGLAPLSWGVGVDDLDPIQAWLAESLETMTGNYHATRHQQWQVETMRCRPPVGRAMLQFRRSAQLFEKPLAAPLQPTHAAAFSHLDGRRIELHQNAVTLAAFTAWYSDPEAAVMSPKVALLQADSIEGENEAALRYLIAAWVGTLPAEQVTLAETVISESETAIAEHLAAVSWTPSRQGMTWAKILPSPGEWAESPGPTFACPPA